MSFPQITNFLAMYPNGKDLEGSPDKEFKNDLKYFYTTQKGYQYAPRE